jgi:hypothetical protein
VYSACPVFGIEYETEDKVSLVSSSVNCGSTEFLFPLGADNARADC